MEKPEEKKQPRKRKPTFISSILSIALVLFILGLVGILVLEFGPSSNSIKERVPMQLELIDGVSDADAEQFTELVKSKNYVRTAKYTSKTDAAEIMQEDLGENFIDIIGANPLFSSVDFTLKAQYVHDDSLYLIEKELAESGYVKALHAPPLNFNAINNTLRNIGLLIFGLAILFFLISMVLIDSSIRLSMFSQRFIIRSMQLVGAKPWFIKKPFVAKSVLNGIISGIISSILVVIVLLIVKNLNFNLLIINNPLKLGALLLALIIFGIIISWFSTQRAVSKYLGMKLDDLY